MYSYKLEYMRILPYTVDITIKIRKTLLCRSYYNFIQKWISADNISQKAYLKIKDSIGGNAVWRSHNTYPSMAQKYKCPMWQLPYTQLDQGDKVTVETNKQRFLDTQEAYHKFSSDLINRL